MFRIVCVLFIIFFPLCSYGDESSSQGAPSGLLRSMPMLASDEPNVLGWTRDSYERAGFMDFTLSMRYPLLFDTLQQGYKFDMLPFISFTGRLAQYSGQIRHSSPVVVKRFNPKLFMRFYEARTADKALWSDDNGLDYYDFGYAHESNGQFVDSTALFDSTAASVGGADVVQDYISRGWDYIGYKRHLFLQHYGLHSLDVELKYFLEYGLLQKGSEEYFDWETARPITRISQVDGLRLKLNFDFRRNWFKGASMHYTTGYRNFARWNTVRMEFGFTPLSDYLGVPIVLWGQSGYNNNISQYYRRAWAVGLAASFETFK